MKHLPRSHQVIGLAGKEEVFVSSARKYGSLAPTLAEFMTLELTVLTRIPKTNEQTYESSVFSPEGPKKSANARENADTAALPPL